MRYQTQTHSSVENKTFCKISVTNDSNNMGNKAYRSNVHLLDILMHCNTNIV